MTRAQGQLVDLFLEMKDRHGLPEPAGEALRTERGEVGAHGPLVLVGMLRASLVTLRDFKRSTERDFGRVRDRQKAAEVRASPSRPPPEKKSCGHRAAFKTTPRRVWAIPLLVDCCSW